MTEAYQFPDEIESKQELDQDLPATKLEIEAKDADFEIEIENDVPKEDRRRRNLPEDVVKDLENDELSQYDEGVQ